MITIIEAKFSHYSDSGVSVNTYLMAGLSSDSDTKPTTEDVGNGSCYIEMDTSKVWFYDERSTTWLEWGAESASAGTLSASPSLSNSFQPINSGLNLGNTFQPSVIDPAVEEETIPDAEEEEELPDMADTSEQDGEDA